MLIYLFFLYPIESKKGCRGEICKCDTAIAICLKKAWETYEDRYRSYRGDDPANCVDTSDSTLTSTNTDNIDINNIAT